MYRSFAKKILKVKNSNKYIITKKIKSKVGIIFYLRLSVAILRNLLFYNYFQAKALRGILFSISIRDPGQSIPDILFLQSFLRWVLRRVDCFQKREINR